MEELNDYQVLKNAFDKLNVQYHEVEEKMGADVIICMRPFRSGEKKGFVNTVVGLYPLKRGEQLGNYFEFCNGKMISCS